MVLIGLLISLAGCHDDDADRRASRRPVSVRIAAYATTYTDVEPASRATRAGVWPPEGFKPYSQLTDIGGALKTNEGAAIAAFFTQGNTKLARKFRPTIGDEWLIDDSVAAGTYQLYGFVPFNGIDTTTIQMTPYNGVSYATGAVLTLNGVNTVSGQDLCVAVAAKDGTKEGNAAPLPVTTPQPGDFTCQFKANENYLFLLFDHLYAALRFRIRLSPEYAELRSIKVRKLELEAYQDADCLTPAKKLTTTIKLQANNTGASPIVEVTNTPSGDDMERALIANHESQPVKVTTAWTDDLGFAPQPSGHSYYMLYTTYDVYDTNVTTDNPDGNLIRSRCVASNKIDPYRLFNRTTDLERGHMYTVYLTVQPTYLYILSDPDLDNPTVTIGN